ncbi:MAG TPA: hypothetical protein VNE61_13185 [Ktedonobacteraceae bacterium]|nr:hypothetical protein [Ktedonobacteraceae bacterium]
MIRHRALRLVIASTLLALLLATFMAFTASANTLVTVHGVTTQVVSIPNTSDPNSNMQTNSHGKVAFKPNKLHCKQVQGQSCNTLTNASNQTIAVYLNGTFFFSSAPGQVNSFFYGGPGKYLYTIPGTNPKAHLTVRVTT